MSETEKAGQPRTGGCQCGAVRFRINGQLGRASICHCRMCQKAFGGFFGPLVAAPQEGAETGVEWTRGEPKYFQSSINIDRGFCGECGTPLTYEGVRSDNLDLTVGSFDEAHRLKPVGHFGVESRHPAWRDTANLPEKRTQDLPNIVSQWMETRGHVPD